VNSSTYSHARQELLPLISTADFRANDLNILISQSQSGQIFAPCIYCEYILWARRRETKRYIALFSVEPLFPNFCDLTVRMKEPGERQASLRVEGIMGAPIRESDRGTSSKTEPPKDAPRDVGLAPSSCAPEVPNPPWKRKSRSNVFEGDIALVELRSQLALKAERIPEPAVLFPTAPMSSGVLRLMSGAALAAVVLAIAGYLWGFKLSIKVSELTSASNHSDVPPALSPALAPAGIRGALNPVSPVDAAHRPASLPTRPQTVSPSVAPRLPVAAGDASAIAAKMRNGVELMTYGEVFAARAMFLRVAEAGEGAGAFALAETYDPIVLRDLRLREQIMPDIALARTWYERARDLGALEARDRISRLSQLPQ
jgi:hypothetical protein